MTSSVALSRNGTSFARFAACATVGALTTVAGAVYGNGNLVLSAVPLLVGLALVLTWFAPIRIPLLLVTFLSLALDGIGEGPWDSPLSPLATALVLNLNKTVPIAALTIPGVVAVCGFLLVIRTHRYLRGSLSDSDQAAAVPLISLKSLAISFLAVLLLCGYGLINGGESKMAKVQVQTFVILLMVAFLYAQALRGMRDYRLLARLVVAAACIKSVCALWVVHIVALPFATSAEGSSFATTHGDSLLFSFAAVLVIVRFAERPALNTGLVCLTSAPLLVAGMFANNRRLVWLELAAGLGLFWMISRRSKLKQFLIRAVILAIPVILLYIGAGWNSQSKVFGPVRTFRSMGDSEVNSSTMYRELENFNLMQTMRRSPVLGTGFGHPFDEVIVLPYISMYFGEYRYMPHNSILGLWAFCGPLGFSGLMFACLVAAYMGARSYRAAHTPDERTAAFMTLAAILIYLIHCWGDIGFSERKSIFLVGPALAVAGQLAVSTGAWPRRSGYR